MLPPQTRTAETTHWYGPLLSPPACLPGCPQESAGGGLVFWHPKGAMVRHLMEGYWKDVHLRRGYQLLYTPHIAKVRPRPRSCTLLGFLWTFGR